MLSPHQVQQRYVKYSGKNNILGSKQTVDIPQTTSSSFFYERKCLVLFQFHWRFCPVSSFEQNSALVQVKACRRTDHRYPINHWLVMVKIWKDNTTWTNDPPLQWRHNGWDCVSNHQPHDCFLNRLFSPRGCGDLSVRLGSRISPHRHRVVVEVHWRGAQGWRSISWVVATFNHVGGSFNLLMAAAGMSE